jgi:hypothetical protein
MKLNRKQRRALKAKGVKLMRSEEELKKMYIDLCTRAGELQYQISQLKLALDEINGKLVDVNREFVELKQSQQKKEETKQGVENVSQSQTD